ncbi:Serine/threonine-protein phosphatase 7 long form homolog [Linum grandiflorum]
MERWRPETNTFHMYHGEVSITLQDVAHLTGLSVSGDALYVEYEKETNWAAIQLVLFNIPSFFKACLSQDSFSNSKHPLTCFIQHPFLFQGLSFSRLSQCNHVSFSFLWPSLAFQLLSISFIFFFQTGVVANRPS